ncbi:Protein charlatan [Camponotus floridanus]|uniref:Protein charlatan n=1 Tax=Camponotus floridanus TaxID=104421 RepID=E2AKB3_CAMFO|nr:myc-associated zinc finger protein isoform X4 [Camponotus floridanus]EFN66126.1 Protein charlatan [Camponotus floridanus]
MEGSGTGIGRLDSYEDMFKEITRKLYGEDPDHRTSSVQNEFEASVSYKNDEDTGNGTDGSDDGNWTYDEEPLKGTDGSRIAAYHAGKVIWRCDECGDVMGGSPRELAEHFMELHSSRILPDNSRNRHHSPRKDYLQTELKIEDVVMYLERLRERAERAAPPSRRTQETQTVPAALLPVTSSFLLQELPSVPAPQHLQQNTATMTTSAAASVSGKRYTCPYCPYGTDRRDLYTRHENIHREEKPFHCYMCFKPFNRADHVKKHFMRMHRDQTYDVSKIRRPVGTSASKPLQQDTATTPTAANASTQPQPQQQHMNCQATFASNKGYQLQPNVATSGTGTIGIYQTTTMPAPGGIMQPDVNNCNTGRRVQNGGCNSKSHLKGGSKSAQERRYSCLYCPWSGVDNWCLKRHLNTHTKPFACSLCEYKAARAERLSTHVLKVHNRRQCSRCSFLGEDAAQLQIHQLHVHRVSSASAPSTSTAQTAPPPSNRHPQPLHPVGGGRPPPGPPVFPAPAPAIAPATTVIPPSTILGYQIMASANQLPDSAEVRLSEPCHSRDPVCRQDEKENQQRPSERRSRKQSQPRQVKWHWDSRCNLIPALGLQDLTNVEPNKRQDINGKIQMISRSRQQKSIRQRMFKCHLCRKYAPTQGMSRRSYHNKASLILHMLWRHKRRSCYDKNRTSTINLSSTVSSITLKATFFTNPNYRYHR